MSQISICTDLINNLSENIKERILNPKKNMNILQKFVEKEKQEVVKVLTDLRDIKSKSESEVYEILNAMVKNNQFFMYCGSLLLNINPGPNYIKGYLNLQAWVKETESKDECSWKPHLYSFMYYVYQTMVSEKKDQVVNMLGQIGSGKTFNIIHIIEYFCCMVGPDEHQIEVFDKIHKSIQLIHIMGSIFRENNLESTSCGIILRLGFGQDNKINAFDIDAKILDCTLPFSENGRSFSILHSFMAASSNDLKRSFNLPENEIHLNFFRKFSNNFSHKTKERFKLNDYEIWNRFHSLLHSFGFQKQEVIEILQIFSFIIMVNELGISKSQHDAKGTPTYTINKGHCSKKLSKNFNISEDDLIKTFGVFKDVSEVKSTLIGLIKYSYYIVFEYIQKKIKDSLKVFFNKINSKNANQTTKYINFLDFPGEVEDSTLGGLLTNLGNECINLYAGNSYSSVIEKLQEEKVNMKLFEPLHCYNIVKSLMGEKGLFSYLSLPFTEDNYNSLQKEVSKQKHFKECLSFTEDARPIKSNSNNQGTEFTFKMNYSSNKSISYNYESLYQETKSITNTARLIKIFALSSNSILKSTYQRVIDPKGDFFKHAYSSIMSLFKAIEGYSPFIVYCLHSNNSHKIFFDKKDQSVSESTRDWVIPRNLTMSLLKKSLCIPVLYWEWFGYSEWIETEVFLRNYLKDFEKIEHKLPKTKDMYGNDIILSQLKNPMEKVGFIINNLLRNCDYAQGKHYILMKKGTSNRLQEKISSLLEPSQIQSDSRRSSLKSNELKNSKGVMINNKGKPLQRNGTNSKNKLILNPPKKKEVTKPSSIIKESSPVNKSQLNINRRNAMKTQCHIAIIDGKTTLSVKTGLVSSLSTTTTTNTNTATHSPLLNENEADKCIRYNVYKIFDHTTNSNMIEEETLSNHSIKERNDIEDFRKKNNIIIPNKNAFSLVQNLFDPSKNKNFKIFDYSKFIPDIIKIQCYYRLMQAKKKHLVFRFIMTQIVLIQSHGRRFVTKGKFNKFQKCLKCVVFIQQIYRLRYQRVTEAAILIQKNFRRWLIETKFQRKLERYRESQVNLEEYVDSSDEEKKGQMMMLEEAKKKSVIIESAKSLKQRVITKKKPKKYYDISTEKNKDKIVSLILRDQELMKENEAINRQLANQKGVSKNVKKELLQINTKKDINEKRPAKMRIEDKLIEYGEELKHKRAQGKVDKLKSEEMQYSFTPELILSQTSYAKVRNVYPNPTSKTTDIANKDFYFRAAFFEETKGNHIEYIKTTIVDPDQAEYTFKPKLSKVSKNIKRTIDDLYAWKKKTERNKEELMKKKELKEAEEINSNHLTTFVNEKSKKMLMKRAIKTQITDGTKGSNRVNRTIEFENNENDNTDEDFNEDLWPVELNKLYG